MRKIALIAIALSFVAFPIHVQAEDTIQHYAAKDIKDTKQALKSFEKNNEKIRKILSADDVTNADLEQIHEISYTLEAAIDKMIADKAAPQAQLDQIDEAVQALHYASEKHEADKVSEWFAKLETALNELDTASDKTAKAQEQDDVLTYEIIIKDHKLYPEEIRAPAGKKLKLVVHNQDPTPEEFESDDMRREKIIPGNSSATIKVGPLKPGKYHYFGEFNLATANGYLIAE